MNVKTTTQSYSAAPQAPQFGNNSENNMGALEQQKLLGDKPLGDIANQIVDPNWVDSEKTKRVGNNELNKDAFFKLMLAQMKNQDPTSPLQSHEMAAQLAQFTSLEKLSNIN